MRERRIVLGLLLAGMLVVGLWALVAPASFHADFPLDRAWVSLDGPYNEHLVRDVGALNLALATLVGWAVAAPTRSRVGLVAAITLVYAVPHLLYHATHLQPFGVGDAVAQLVVLALTVLAPVWLLGRLRTAAA